MNAVYVVTRQGRSSDAVEGVWRTKEAAMRWAKRAAEGYVRDSLRGGLEAIRHADEEETPDGYEVRHRTGGSLLFWTVREHEVEE